MKKKEMKLFDRKSWIYDISRKMLWIAILLFSVLATVKVCFLNLGVDEEYAVTMSYRIVAGDQMFQEMWEPHQMSGFLSAILIKIFILITGETEYLILYLRICGCFLQFLISVFLYQTTKKIFQRDICFIAAAFFYNTLPKWIQTPEFSNMLIWFSVLTFLCFLRYYYPAEEAGKGKKGTGSPAWLIGAGISVSCMVLSYPSCILSLPFILISMWMVQKNEKSYFQFFIRETILFLAPCVALGSLYISFFLSRMSPGDFLYGISQMMTDGSHSQSLWGKILAWAQELLQLLPHALFTLALAFLVAAFIRKMRTLNRFLLLWLCATLLEQVVIWLGNSRYLHRPLLYFYVLILSGWLVYRHSLKKNKTVKYIYSFLFWMGIVTGTAIWFSALLITNTTISVTGSYLMIGLLSALFLIDESIMIDSSDHKKSGYALQIFMALCLIGTTLLVKGYLVCSYEGTKETVTMARQKVLYGPAKGIYCRYMDGYVLNLYADLLGQIAAEKKVLYVGGHALIYLYGDQIICNFSTISTPTYDERLLEYWEKNPERYPELVILDTTDEQIEKIAHLIPLGDMLASEHYLGNMSEIRVYEVAADL